VLAAGREDGGMARLILFDPQWLVVTTTDISPQKANQDHINNSAVLSLGAL